MLVLGLSQEAFMGAVPIALGLESIVGEGLDEVALAYVGDEGPWAPSVRSWYLEQDRRVSVRRLTDIGDAVHTYDRVVAVGTSFADAIPASVQSHADAIFALTAAGVDAAELDTIRTRLLELGGVGVLTVEQIARFGQVGREYVELVEHVHHVTGPMGQSRVADTLRAALFGKSGRVPVNLDCREDPPMLDPLTTMVFYVSLSEL